MNICLKVNLKVRKLGLSHDFYCLLVLNKNKFCKVDPALGSEGKLKFFVENFFRFLENLLGCKESCEN